jgi:hypothetical protein
MTRVAAALERVNSALGLIAASQRSASGCLAALAEVTPRRSRKSELSGLNDILQREPHGRSRQSCVAPRSVFDPLYSGLAADAAVLDAAIIRRACRR